MGSGKVLIGADRNDAGRINVVVRDVVVPLDMVEIHGLGDAVCLVEVFEISEEVWVVENSSDIALEMSVVDRIKPNQRDEEPPIGLHTFRPEEIAAGGEACIQLIQRGKQSPCRSFVGLL